MPLDYRTLVYSWAHAVQRTAFEIVPSVTQSIRCDGATQGRGEARATSKQAGEHERDDDLYGDEADYGQRVAAKKHLRRREQRILKLRHRIAGMKRTWSWRLTRPFRRLARALGR